MAREFKSEEIRLVIGIGNPGKKYENTFHNVGLRFVDFLKENRVSENEFKLHSSKIFSYVKSGCVILAKSHTFMNQSGESVSRILKFSGTDPEKMLIVHDDSDIAIDSYKIAFDRGSAGHHGIDSITTHLKTHKFWRLRIGIREKNSSENRTPASEFVLKKISPEERDLFENLFYKLSESVLSSSEKNDSLSIENETEN